MATLFEADHDSGGTPATYWTTEIDSGARASITAPGLNSTAGKVSVTYAAADPTVQLIETGLSAPASDEIRWRFRIDTNSLDVSAMGDGDAISTHYLDAGSVATRFAIITIQADGSSGYKVEWARFADLDGGSIVLATEAISDGEHCIEMAIVRSSAALQADGSYTCYLDGVEIFTQSQVIFTRFNNFARSLNIFDAVSDNATGTYFFDEFILTDDAATALCPVPPAGNMQIAAMTKPVDIDADGSFLYIAGLDTSGNPILIKFSTAIDANGTKVFDPGSGTDIGVQCGRFDTDTIWIAGAFDSTNTVEKSEDAGTSFVVKDPGTFGAVSAFTVGPDTDDRVLVIDDGVDIQETIDDGGEWIAKNTGLTPATKSLARLDINVEEVAFGNESGASDNVDYSVNVGADLEDLSLPVMADVNDIIVN